MSKLHKTQTKSNTKHVWPAPRQSVALATKIAKGDTRALIAGEGKEELGCCSTTTAMSVQVDRAEIAKDLQLVAREVFLPGI